MILSSCSYVKPTEEPEDSKKATIYMRDWQDKEPADGLKGRPRSPEYKDIAKYYSGCYYSGDTRNYNNLVRIITYDKPI